MQIYEHTLRLATKHMEMCVCMCVWKAHVAEARFQIYINKRWVRISNRKAIYISTNNSETNSGSRTFLWVSSYAHDHSSFWYKLEMLNININPEGVKPWNWCQLCTHE